MYRKFIAAVAAASIALTTLGSVPAAADEQDTARAIATILGLAVVGAAIHERNKKKKKKARHHKPDPVYRVPRTDFQQHKKHLRPAPPAWGQHKPRPLPKRVGRKLLPQQCFRSVETYRGTARMFGARCLNRHFAYADRLPRRCYYTFRTHRGERRGYEARCLRDRGYRLARG